jgi:mono/diheme cytochrome c family protein
MRETPVGFIIALASLSVVLLCGAGAASQQSKTTWNGVYSGEQAAEGEAIYLERCAGCHQPDLSGGDDAPQLAGALFGVKWNDRTLAELFDRMRRTMPKDEPGSLTAAECAQLIAYLLRRNGFPEGASALSDRPDGLREIRFVVLRPPIPGG